MGEDTKTNEKPRTQNQENVTIPVKNSTFQNNNES